MPDFSVKEHRLNTRRYSNCCWECARRREMIIGFISLAPRRIPLRYPDHAVIPSDTNGHFVVNIINIISISHLSHYGLSVPPNITRAVALMASVLSGVEVTYFGWEQLCSSMPVSTRVASILAMANLFIGRSFSRQWIFKDTSKVYYFSANKLM
jgi:hypothetical protein